jgi:hypothetical protein
MLSPRTKGPATGRYRAPLTSPAAVRAASCRVANGMA